MPPGLHSGSGRISAAYDAQKIRRDFMKKTFKSLLSLALCLMMIVSTFAIFGVGASAAGAKKNGDTIEMGTYPQSEVTDKELVAELEKDVNGKEWTSYRYDTGSPNWRDGRMRKDDYMKYVDFTHGKEKYRAVKFSSYRPSFVGYKASEDTVNAYQYDNGYLVNKTYFFKFEPIKWRIVDTSTGLCVSDLVLDAQPFNDYVYKRDAVKPEDVRYFGDTKNTILANNYESSSIRKWLQSSFYDVAFTSDDIAKMALSEYEEKCYKELVDKGLIDSISDKAYLMSDIEVTYYKEILTASNSLVTKGSDYSKSQGLWIPNFSTNTGLPYWRLRSATGITGEATVETYYVNTDGLITNNSDVDFACAGIRPAVRMKVCDHEWDWVTILEPTEEAEGEKAYQCKKCGAVLMTDYILILNPPVGHIRVDIKNNPVSKTRSIRWRRNIKLTATTLNATKNSRIAWYVDGELKQISEKGNNASSTFTTDRLKKDTVIEARLLDVNGKIIHNKDTSLALDHEEITVRKNIFAYILAFIFMFLPPIPVVQ